MAKQILIGIREQELSVIAHYLMIYFPYNEEMCSYTDAWVGELYENKYPLHEEERKLLFINLSIPDKINLNGTEFEKTKKVNELLLYLQKTDELILQYNSNQ